MDPDALHPMPPPPPGLPHEPAQDVNLRAIGTGALSLFVLLLLGLGGAAWIFHLRAHANESEQSRRGDDLSPSAERLSSSSPVEPPLDADARATLREVRAHENEMLSTYRWVDRAAGVVAIPIERAMELVGREGLPVVTPPKGPKGH